MPFNLASFILLASVLGSAPTIIKVPLTRQATDYTCGAAAVQSVIGYYGENQREEMLAKELRSNSTDGTDYPNIIAFAKRRGYKVDVVRNCTLDGLKKLLDAGRPVICLVQAWPERKVDYTKDWADGHYVVAVGYDSEKVYVMDPCTLGNYAYVPISEFMTRWHDRNKREKLVHFALTMTKDKPAFDATAIQKME